MSSRDLWEFPAGRERNLQWGTFLLIRGFYSESVIVHSSVSRICVVVERAWASQMALVVKNPPANAGDIETWDRSLDWEDPLKKGMAAHSSFLIWRIP